MWIMRLTERQVHVLHIPKLADRGRDKLTNGTRQQVIPPINIATYPEPLPSPAGSFFLLFALSSRNSFSFSARSMYCVHFARIVCFDRSFFSSVVVNQHV